jgi:hypothetical protein
MRTERPLRRRSLAALFGAIVVAAGLAAGNWPVVSHSGTSASANDGSCETLDCGKNHNQVLV